MHHSPLALDASRPSALALAVMLSACGGGRGHSGESATASAHFFDSPVEGLEYSSGDLSGETDRNGLFQYRPGTPVTFSVGNIQLGSCTPSGVVSPVNLAAGATHIDDAPRILNIARFLQTIDADNTVQNGIRINAATRVAAIGESIDFDLDTAEWGDDPDVLAAIDAITTHSLTSASDAWAHLNAWLAAAHAGAYSGEYSGTNDGAIGFGGFGEISGEWWMSVTNTGTVILVANQNGVRAGGQGSVDANGAFTVQTDYAALVGLVAGTDVTGTWTGNNDLEGFAGDMSGTLETGAMPFLDIDHIEDFDGIDGQSIWGELYDDYGSYEGFFEMLLQEDEHGLHDLTMASRFLDDPAEEFDASLYATSMSIDTFEFSGLCTNGDRITGVLHSDGTVSGTREDPDSGEPGGTFTGDIP